jgi:hypothetical protein
LKFQIFEEKQRKKSQIFKIHAFFCLKTSPNHHKKRKTKNPTPKHKNQTTKDKKFQMKILAEIHKSVEHFPRRIK